MNKYLVPAVIQSRKALRQAISFGMTSEGVVCEIDQAMTLCDQAIEEEKEIRELARSNFEREYSVWGGCPASVLVNLRDGDRYLETDGERLNIAWDFYLKGVMR